MADFTTLIQGWFRRNRRDLPWRRVKNPYNIWLSEVILQQTRVDQGMEYYLRFIEKFPTVQDLAKANEDEVLNMWQGLGYYSRARNLHSSAKQVVNEFKGEFPMTFQSIKSLKGVGDYTAAAIASIAYGLPHAVVDGNVYRVLSRYFAIDTPIDSTKGQKDFADLARELLDETHPGDHNQALMELGALVCSPKNPSCDTCPLAETCLARSTNSQLNFPVKEKKTKVTKRYLNYLVLTDGEQTIVQKRTGKGIWQGLYDFPCIEKTKHINLSMEDLKAYQPLMLRADGQFKHILSHQEINAQFWVVSVDKLVADDHQSIVSLAAIEGFPLPQLLIRYLRQSPLFGAD